MITLSTDYNIYDFYLAKVKLRLNRLFSSENFVDLYQLAENTTKTDFRDIAFNINALKEEFSAPDIHLIFVNQHYQMQQHWEELKTDDFYYILAISEKFGHFIMPNNGFLGLLDIDFQEFKKITVPMSTFPELDLLERIKTKDFSKFPSMEKPLKLSVPNAQVKGETLVGTVSYIDGYGNVIVNISRQQFDDFVKGDPFEIVIRRESKQYISKGYQDLHSGDFVICFNHLNLMEIAFLQDSAAGLLGLKKNSTITVKRKSGILV